MDQTRAASITARVFESEGIDVAAAAPIIAVYEAIADQIVSRARANAVPLVLGICGSQGSGKSTMARVLERILSERDGLSVAGFSIDDIYLSSAERQRLAQMVHPLLRTRGVPGTHDVKLGMSVMDALAGAAPDTNTRVPRFDKAVDDRAPTGTWPLFQGRPDVIIFEGWCVGARPEDEAALAEPVNELERVADPDGVWRRYVNSRLAGEYQELFARLDLLLMIRAPSFEKVFEWRQTQEHKLKARLGIGAADASRPAGVMDDQQLEWFIRHYERLTRHILAELPGRADMVVSLRDERLIAEFGIRDGDPHGHR